MPIGYSQDPMVRLLDITAATLTLERQLRLARTAAQDRVARAESRVRALREVGYGEQARWVADRWIRWTTVFSLPTPIPLMGWVSDQAAAPFTALDSGDERAAGALSLFDAVLGLVATPETEQGQVDRAVLTAAWRHECLPAEQDADTVYGLRTPAARQCLTTSARLPRAAVEVLLTTRIGISAQQWSAARAEAMEAAAGPEHHLYAAHFLYHDAVAAAEIAAWEKPTDPLLATALWGAAVTAAYNDRLSPAAIAILTRPWNEAGLTPGTVAQAGQLMRTSLPWTIALQSPGVSTCTPSLHVAGL